MISIIIDNQKDFTSRLLVKNDFDNLLFINGSIKTFADFSIDGKLNKDYYSSEEDISDNTYTAWSNYKNICYNMLKGTRKPLSFKFNFIIPSEIVDTFKKEYDLRLEEYFIKYLNLNIRFENGVLSVVTAITSNGFSLDKTAENLYDKFICNYFTNLNIEYKIL